MEKKKSSKMIITLALVGILLIGAALRFSTFFLPHNNGDQLSFLSLAMKMEREGLKGYNLWGVDLISVNNGDMIAFMPSKNKIGNYLELLEADNVFYYSQESLSNMPPAFSYLVMLSKKLFSKSKLFLTLNVNQGLRFMFNGNPLFWKSQFYATWINFFFSLIFIAAVFFLGRVLFDSKVGLVASLLLTFNAVDILTAQRIWTDEMVAVFTILAVLLYWYGRKNQKSPTFSLLAGLSAGIAMLTKQSGCFVLFIIIISEILISLVSNKEKQFLAIFNSRLMIFVATALIVSSFWYYRITSIYGVPWYMPDQKGIETQATWFIFLSHRPVFGQFFYFFVLCPVFSLFYVEAIIVLLKKELNPERILCLVWFTFYVIALTLIPAREERYMLPAYPAIAFFSVLGLRRLRLVLSKNISNKLLSDMILVSFLLFSIIYSVSLGVSCVKNNEVIFNLFN